ncbi:MAG: hypothetical protein QXD70_04870, partial [Candidatus Bathyarchaeia archaeon]
ENLREVLKMLKHRKASPFYCPRCASPKIHVATNLDFGLTSKRYVCENCGYYGPIVMEIEKEGNDSSTEDHS